MTPADLMLPPVPRDIVEAERVNYTRRSRRMLYGQYEADLRGKVRAAVGNVRAEAWEPVDLSAMPFPSLWSQLAVLHAVPPSVVAPAGAEAVPAALAACGYWPLMRRVQRDTLGLREMLVHYHLAPGSGRVVARPVYPDMVSVACEPGDPASPVEVREWQRDDALGWVEVVTRAGADPALYALDKDGRDASAAVLGRRYEGDDYPWRRSDGAAVLPYVTYHAAETGCTWDTYATRELVEGCLMLGVYLTFFGHVLRSASWPQRYAIGAQAIGADAVDADGLPVAGRREVLTDPATLLELAVDPSYQGQPLVGQWQTSADPRAVLQAVSMYERRVLTLAGVHDPGVTRQEADIRSGYSLAVSRESAREAQRAYEPQFRRGDEQALAVVAALLNSETGTAYPDVPGDYRVVYEALPRAPAERLVQVQELAAREAAGLVGPVSAYMELHPGTPRAEAVEAVARTRLESNEVTAAMSRLAPATRE